MKRLEHRVKGWVLDSQLKKRNSMEYKGIHLFTFVTKTRKGLMEIFDDVDFDVGKPIKVEVIVREKK